jgi:glycosyltransferase involved in cell wall biosynthesis
MRILQVVTRSEAGGAQSVVAALSSELSSRGHEVIIASGQEGGGEAWTALDSAIRLVEIPGLVRGISLHNEYLALRSLRSLYRSLRPDIVHLHTSKAGALGRLAGGISPRRIVYTMHGFDQLRISNRRFLSVDKALRGHCASIVAVSDCDRELMSAEGYRTVTIRNGCPDARLVKAPAGDMISRLHDLRTLGLPIILMVARNAAPKRIDLARAAANLLQGQAVIAWIGGEPMDDDPGNFVALGNTNRVGACLGLADVFLLLSEHEGLSMSLIEALSAGLPIVASSVGGCLEILGLSGSGEGPVGIAVANDAKAATSGILRLCQDQEARERMGKAARELWQTSYSSGRMADGYLTLYEAIRARDI